MTRHVKVGGVVPWGSCRNRAMTLCVREAGTLTHEFSEISTNFRIGGWF